MRLPTQLRHRCVRHVQEPSPVGPVIQSAASPSLAVANIPALASLGTVCTQPRGARQSLRNEATLARAER